MKIFSLILGELYAKLCGAKHIIRGLAESCYSSFTHQAIIRLKLQIMCNNLSLMIA